MDSNSELDGARLSKEERRAVVNNQWAYVEGMLDNAVSRASVARQRGESTTQRRKEAIQGMLVRLEAMLRLTESYELRDQR